MVFTACLFPFYVIAAAVTNSTAILTDLLSTTFDLVALTACWFVLRRAHTPNLGRYAYGLGKLENLAELLIALLQIVLVALAGTSAITQLLNPEGVEGAELGLLITAIAVAGNIYLSQKAGGLAKTTRSPVLEAQARVHFLSALGSSAVFFVTAIQSIFPNVPALYYLDPAGSFVVIGFMLHSIYAMLTNSVASLLDQAIDEAGQLRILKALATHFYDFRELGDIRTRQLGGKMFVELHLDFDDDWTMAKTRAVVTQLTNSVKHEFSEAGDDVEVAVVLMPKPAEQA